MAEHQVKTLDAMFRSKMVKIKETCATHFARVDSQYVEITHEIGKLSKVVENLEKQYATEPIQSAKAQLFVL